MKKSPLCIVFFMLSLSLMATETKVTVRAKAKDAKFIGSSIGGAYIIIRNTLTDEILAQGKTEGSTGNTTLIMKTDRKRGVPISDEHSAKFLATIDIEEPVFVKIEAHAPLNRKQATAVASTELWLIPGKHLSGDGVILEVPGFVVDILNPRTHQYIKLDDVKNTPFNIQANVVMMCGCTISSGGTWNSDDMEVSAIVKKDGVLFNELPLALASVNLFEGSIRITEPGHYEVIVYAYNEKSGNTGVDKVNYVISQ
ncbi:hypothetical protein FNH22_23240 [Fulvivirga sp. M361]|uniref:hypothetical protein n=1 Tax=Fulvivirga sp. M361 TaxID=2594266 RepID=UPI00117B2BA2|nr:hypothetical protein [Fulvivirga sp. M361]TRX51872.1 hypothetical protein FNH22_23240 [Fulvivirga sp. M361]